MRSIVKKEWYEIVCSPTGWLYGAVFAIVPGLFLWIFPGTFNLPDSGYSDLSPLFNLLSILLLVMTPAISMRSYADEKRLGTWSLLRSRPVSLATIFASKFLAVWAYSILCILPSIVTVVSIWHLGFPKGNIDTGQLVVSYFALFLLSAIYSATGLFTSSQTKNVVASFISATFINFSVFYGFGLLSELFLSGASQVMVSDIGLSNHFEETNKGIVHLNSLLVFIAYFILFTCLTLDLSSEKQRSIQRMLPKVILPLFFIIGNGLIPSISKDFTSDQRYTLSEYSLKMLSKLRDTNKTIEINVYLEGKLNSSFVRFQKEIDHLLKDANSKSGYLLKINYIDPLQSETPQKVYQSMMAKGMKGIMLNETDRNGRISRQLIFPYLEFVQGKDSLRVNILKNIPGNTAEDNLKASTENFEYELIDALRVVTSKQPQAIAFVEGHNELPRPYLYDAEETLAKYYSINRGEITNDVTILNQFKVVIIAGPTQKYTEQQKYVLDQYIMNGGRVLWLLDGVYFSEEQLNSQGKSVTVANNTSLDDLLFNYGIRINPVLLQDLQSASLAVNSGESKNPQPTIIPWYFCPLLIPSPNTAVTKDIAPVKAPYISSIDLIPQPTVHASVLLTTSDKTHIVNATDEVSFNTEDIHPDSKFFNWKYLITSASLEGEFTSAYLNRMVPIGIEGNRQPQVSKSKHSKMIVVASSSIIRNELAGQGEETQVVPLGFDRASGQQFGNKDFIVNAINWLAGDDDLIQLRQKKHNIHLINKAEIHEHRNLLSVVNLILPILLLGFCLTALNLLRKRKQNQLGLKRKE